MERSVRAMSDCKITSGETVLILTNGFIVDGSFRTTLEGCSIEPGVKFNSPSLVDNSAETKPSTPTSQVSVGGELSELQGLLKLLDGFGASPLLTLAILGGFFYLKVMKLKQPQSCIACEELTPRVSKLEAANRATDAELADISKQLVKRPES